MGRPIEELLDFPCDYTFRLVAASRPELLADCSARVEEALGRELLRTELRPSAGGRWSAVRLTVHLVDGAEWRAVQAALAAVEGLQLLL